MSNPLPPGTRIEIPVHYDMWVRGARFGTVGRFVRGRPGHSDFVYVEMDHPQIKRHLKLWRMDWDYVKVL